MGRQAEVLGGSSSHGLKDGSNSNRQPMVPMAGGMTHGRSSMPRHVRWRLAGRLLRNWAAAKPMIVFRTTATKANRLVWKTITQNRSRPIRYSKLRSPMNSVMRRLSIEM